MAASSFPLSYNEMCPVREGDSVPWSVRAPCRPAASARTEKLEKQAFSAG